MAFAETRQLDLVLKLQDQASTQLQNFQGKVDNLQPAFRRMAAVGTASLAAVSFGIKKAVDAAGFAEEVETRFAASFDETEDRVRKFADTFAEEFGRAETDIKSMSATLAGTLRAGTSLAESQVADMNEELVLAAEGMAAFDERIVDGSQAMNAFAKAMMGQTDTLLGWGFNVSVATQKEKALEMGLIEAEEELDNNSRALAMQALIMEQTQGPIEALNDSEGTYAETKRRLSAQVQNVSETLGNTFLPIISDVMERLVPLVEKVAEWVKENPELTKKIIIATGAIAGIVAVIGGLGMILSPAIAGIKGLISVMALAKTGAGLLAGSFTVAGGIIPVLGALTVAVGLVIAEWNKMKDTQEELKKSVESVGKSLDEAQKKVGSLSTEKANQQLRNSIAMARELNEEAEKLANMGFFESVGFGFKETLKGVGRSIGMNVDDAVITPQGQIIKTNPADYIFATKNPADMQRGVTVVNNFTNTMMIDRNNASTVVDLISEEVRKRLRL